MDSQTKDQNMFYNWLISTWDVISTSAPWLLLGFLGAGIIHVLLPNHFVKRHLQRPGFKSVLKASAVGIPLPLCSCSVIPVGISLRRHGASRGATASFFVSTPEIGVDSFLLSYVLLGPFLAITRIVAVLLSAVGTGTAIDLLAKYSKLDEGRQQGVLGGELISSVKGETNPNLAKEIKKCCSHRDRDPHPSFPVQFHANSILNPIITKLKSILYFAYVELVDDIAVVLTIGFISAGFITAMLPHNLFHNIGLGPVTSILVMLFAALPTYVCATSSTPFIAALLAKGLSPGAALVFLLAGPATNISTMLVISKELGKQALALYICGIAGIAVLCGIVVDKVARVSLNFNPVLLPQDEGTHTHDFNFLGVILALLMLVGLLKKLRGRVRVFARTHGSK